MADMSLTTDPDESADSCPPPVRLTGVSAGYHRSHPVLQTLDLEVPSGQFLVILGSSGSGKTSLLRVIAGLLRPSTGKAELFGHKAFELRPEERSVGFVFQSLALFPSMTVAKNIEFGLRYSHLPRSEWRTRVGVLLDALQLTQVANRRPRQLSGGQAQRAALARALAPTPRVLLLDEPFSNLDRPLADEASNLVTRLHIENHLTTIMVTHDREQGLAAADRVVVLSHDGRILQDGSPENVYSSPRDVEVARLTGPTTIVTGHIASRKAVDSVEVKIEGGTIQASFQPSKQDFKGGDLVQVMLRPEWASLWQEPVHGTQVGLIQGSVVRDSKIGRSRIIHCKVGRQMILVEVPRTHRVEAGATVLIRFSEKQAIAYSVTENTDVQAHAQ